MKMKKSPYKFLSPGLAAILIAAVLSFSCKSSEVYCYWSPGPVVVDGQLDDWKGTMAHWFKDQNIVIGVANDSNNLYLSMRMNDERMARTISLSGLTLWIDANGKKEKDFELIFRDGPMGRGDPTSWGDPTSRGDGRRGGREQYGYDDDYDDNERRGKIREPLLRLKPSKDQPARQIAVDGLDGPAAAFDTSNGLFTWEFSIPFVKLGDSLFGIISEPGRQISIGARWGEIDRSAMQGMRGGGEGFGGGGGKGGGRGGGMGGRGGGGGRDGGMGGRGAGEQHKRPQMQELWIKTTLAMPGDTHQE